MVAYRAKPTGFGLLNRSDPLAANLVAAWIFSDRAGKSIDLVSGQTIKWQSALSFATAIDGPAPNFAGSTQYGFTADKAGSALGIKVTAPFSIACRVTPASGNSNFARIIETDYATGFFLGTNGDSTAYDWIVNDSGASGSVAGSIVAGTSNSLVGTYAGTTATLFVDGAGGVATSKSGLTNTSLPVYVGTAGLAGPGTLGFLGDIHYLYIWSGRAIIQAETTRLHANPYSLARPASSAWSFSRATTPISSKTTLLYRERDEAMRFQERQLNTADYDLVFKLVSSTDFTTPAIGATPTVTISKAGGTMAAPAGAVSEIGGGFYKVARNASDVNTLGLLALAATASGAVLPPGMGDAYTVIKTQPLPMPG